MGATIAEKILARASGKKAVKPDEYVLANIDLAMIHDAWSFVGPILSHAGVPRVWDADKIVTVFDHFNPPPTIKDAEAYKTAREAVKKYKIKYFYGQNAGICHQVFVEKGHILPGMLIVGTDSHTMTYGALGAAGASLGFSEMAYVATTGTLWFKVPKSMKFNIKGKLARRVMSKDVILYLAGKYSENVAQYMSVEYTGQTIKNMSLASRMTLANMTAEIGAKFAFIEPDEKVTDYLMGRSKNSFEVVKADADASYEQIYEENVANLEPQVSLPFSVDHVKPVSKVNNVKIDQAVLGSCTNGRLEDLRIAAEILRNKKIHADVRLLVIPASSEIYREALKEGLIDSFMESGAIFCHSCCGPCNGGHMGLLASGEVCISSSSRNFKNRMGSPGSEVYLASPATVAASAIEGKVADPRNY
jgi:3-isopropylmalate/(R)-2-methylmalate dehydratase large subunit